MGSEMCIRDSPAAPSDSLDLEVWVVIGLLSPAAVDDKGNVVDSDRSLRDVGGEHDLP